MAASVAAATILGVSAWGIFKSPPGQLAARPINVVLPTSSAPPTTNVSAPDRSTPDNTLASLCHAYETADRAGVYACLLTDPNKPKSPLDADTDWDLANRRMILAGEQVYGRDAETSLNSFYTPLEAALKPIVAFRRLQGDPATINGNAATITLKFPSVLMQSLPAGAQEIMRTWNGKPLYFQLQNGAWRIDLDRSIRIVMRIWKQQNGQPMRRDDQLAIAIFEQQAKDYDFIAQQISLGDLPQLADAQRAVQLKYTQMLSKLGIYGFLTDVVPK